MATLKDHQQAMVDLLASGSGIPASASRLAHAMHDVLAYITGVKEIFSPLDFGTIDDATTPGLNDKALAADVEACRPKDTMFDRACAAERRVKELENTVKQLRASTAEFKNRLSLLREQRDSAELRLNRQNEQAGCRKDDTQVVDAISKVPGYTPPYFKDAKSCIHNWQQTIDVDFRKCVICGAVEDIYQ